MMIIKEVIKYLESIAPLSSQEVYDNCGLIVGNQETELKGLLVSLDCIEDTVNEAIRLGCNLIVSHHPIVFKGLKKFNGQNYVQRTVIKAIKNDIAIYAIHTNLDNARFGVNAEIGKRLGLTNLSILAPKKDVLNKIVCFIPENYVPRVTSAMFDAGAGEIGDYTECSFLSKGTGTFKPVNDADPFAGQLGVKSTVDEVRLEVLVSTHKLSEVLRSMKSAHPYEEVAYEIYPIRNENQFEGSGMIGELPVPISELDFLLDVKKNFNCEVIRHTKLFDKLIKKIAFCGGSGSFLLNDARRKGADIFITGDFKYHEFFDAEDDIIIADIGHFESEQFTSHLIADLLTKKFPTFAVHLTEVKSNPINYL